VHVGSVLLVHFLFLSTPVFLAQHTISPDPLLPFHQHIVVSSPPYNRRGLIKLWYYPISAPYPSRTHTCGALSARDAGSRVILTGWLLPER